MRRSIANSIRLDPRNLAWCYEQELAWKRGQLKENHTYILDLARNGPRARKICGGSFVDLCRQFAEEHGRIPSLLDVGCGPVTSFAYLSHEGLANVVGVDPLAVRYAALLADFGLESPAQQLNGAGEWLERVFPDRVFDIVATRNALDHHQCPPLAWLRLFERTRVGGYIAQSHSIREATKEGWKQLHQYDLYPDDENTHLKLDDSEGRHICLTSALPLEKVCSTANRNADGTGWFTSVYRKQNTVVSAEFYASVLEHAAFSLAKRHEWALALESAIEDFRAQPGIFRRETAKRKDRIRALSEEVRLSQVGHVMAFSHRRSRSGSEELEAGVLLNRVWLDEARRTREGEPELELRRNGRAVARVSVGGHCDNLVRIALRSVVPPIAASVYSIHDGISGEMLAALTTPALGRSRRVVGAVENSERAEVRGWVLDPGSPERRRRVAVHVDGALREVVTAGEHRGDIARWKGTGGHHGFRWRIPEGVAAKDGTRIDVFDAVTGRALRGSPLRIEAGRVVAGT